MVTNMFSTMDSNDLGALKKYLDTGKSGVEQYTNAIEYKYSVSPQIYKENKDSIRQVNPDQSFSAMGLGFFYKYEQYDVIYDEYRCFL